MFFLIPKLSEMSVKETHMDKNSNISKTGYPNQGGKTSII